MASDGNGVSAGKRTGTLVVLTAGDAFGIGRGGCCDEFLSSHYSLSLRGGLSEPKVFTVSWQVKNPISSEFLLVSRLIGLRRSLVKDDS